MEKYGFFSKPFFLLLAVRWGGRRDAAVGMAHEQTGRKSVVAYCRLRGLNVYMLENERRNV